MIRYEDYNIISDKLKHLGYKLNLFDNETNDTDKYNKYLYRNLIYAFNYYQTMLTDKNSEVSLEKQFNIDAYLSYAIDLKMKSKENPLDNKQKINYRTIKRFLLEEMKKNNPLIIATILFDNNEYYKVLFADEESEKIMKNYLNYCVRKAEELINRYLLNEKMDSNEKLLLFKILESGLLESDLLKKLELDSLKYHLLDNKYKQQIKNIKRLLIYKCENEESLERYELEYILRECAKEKCRKKNMVYNKLYLECDITRKKKAGGFAHPGGLVCINLKYAMEHSSFIIPTVFHEYEHRKQHQDAKAGDGNTDNKIIILNRDSLSYVFRMLLSNSLSKKNQYDEYKSNYRYKLHEIYANEAARQEYQLLLWANCIRTRKQIVSTAKGVPAKLYRDSIINGFQKTEDGTSYSINFYNVGMIDKILKEKIELIEKYPLLKHFYNVNEKRLKNLVELSEDYSKQDVSGRNTFNEFVEYQIYQGNLNEIDLSKMTEIQKLNLLLMITRYINDLLPRIIMIAKNEKPIKEKNKALYENLSRGIQFLRNNIEHIKRLEREYNHEIPLSTSEKQYFYLQFIEEYQKKDYSLTTKLQERERSRLGISTSSCQHSPFSLMKRYSTDEISKIIDSVNDKGVTLHRVDSFKQMSPDVLYDENINMYFIRSNIATAYQLPGQLSYIEFEDQVNEKERDAGLFKMIKPLVIEKCLLLSDFAKNGFIPRQVMVTEINDKKIEHRSSRGTRK